MWRWKCSSSHTDFVFPQNISQRSGRVWGSESAWKTSRNLFKGIDRVSWRAQKVWRDHPGSHNLSGIFLFFIALCFSEKNRANKYIICLYIYMIYVSYTMPHVLNHSFQRKKRSSTETWGYPCKTRSNLPFASPRTFGCSTQVKFENVFTKPRVWNS